MIKSLSVKNFKSRKELDIGCRRINLFIGEPNTGKSNILEVLGLLSWCGNYVRGNPALGEYIRFQTMRNLFYDGSLDNPIEVEIENARIKVSITFEEDVFQLRFEGDLELSKGGNLISNGRLNYSGVPTGGSIHTPISELAFVKFYRFDEKQDQFPHSNPSFLMPPHGSNMFAVVLANSKLQASMAEFFKGATDFGLELVLQMQERTFGFQKRIKDEYIDRVINYPYVSISDTLQRMIFYVIAIESNENSTLVFEEPETHTFPDYTHYLGEKIAFDESNQYFVATHNPYLLLSILEKTQKNDVNVFVTYYRDYQTKVKRLNDEEKSELMIYDPFSNLDHFIESVHSLVEGKNQ